MARRSLIFPILGLACGLVIGAVVMGVNRFAAHQFVQLLEEEVSKACDCSFKADSVEVSLLTLSARATNARILQNGTPKLQVKKVYATFSLEKISEKKVLLSDLLLDGVFIDGVGDESVIYKFIDSISTSPPASQQNPDRWKLKLQGIRVLNGEAREDFRTRILTGKGLALTLRRDEKDDFLLLPSIRELELFPKDSPNSIMKLGGVTATLNLRDSFVEWHNVKLLLDSSQILVNAKSFNQERNRVEGQAEYYFDSQSFDRLIKTTSGLNFSMQGKAQVAGRLPEPTAAGNLETLPSSSFIFTLPFGKKITFDGLNFDHFMELANRRFLMTVPRVETGNAITNVRVVKPLGLDIEDISGTLGIKISSIEVEGIKAAGIDAELELGGTIFEPLLSVHGTMEELGTHTFALHALDFSAAQKSVDEIAIRFNHSSKAYGSLSAQGSLGLKPELEFRDVSLKLENVRPSPGILVNAEGMLSGPALYSQLKSNLKFTIKSALEDKGLLSGQAVLENKIIKFNAFSPNNSIKIDLAVTPGEKGQGDLNFTLNKLDGNEFGLQLECASLSADGNYHFELSDPLKGAGAIKLKNFQLGCDAYQLQLLAASQLNIAQGVLKLGNLEFTTAGLKNSSLALTGSVGLDSGLDLSAAGGLDLQTFLSLVPSLDELRGKLAAKLKLTGPFASPVLSGEASVADAGLSIESAGIAASNIFGDLVLAQNELRVKSLRGKLNGGQVQAGGSLFPFDPGRSNLSLEFNDVEFDPLPEASVSFGGRLDFLQDLSGLPVIRGQVAIQSAEFQKNLDLTALLRMVSRAIFAATPRQIKGTNSEIPEIMLDIKLDAPRNMFFTTTWLAAELKAKLEVRGLVASPQIQGNVETITGWLGLRDRRFEITAGTINFKPGSLEPTIDMLAEAAVRSQSGDNVMLILEASGPLTNPRIKMSSDQGLPQREIIRLLASGRASGTSMGSNSLLSTQTEEEIDWEEEGIIRGVIKFMRSLTRIDSLSLEPRYNIRTGQVEPGIVATKSLSENTTLLGDSSLGSSVNQSRVQLLFDLTEGTTFSLSAEAQTDQRNTAVGADLSRTILADYIPLIRIDVEGNQVFSRDRILRAARINENSRLRPDDLATVEQQLRAFLDSEGYFEAFIQITPNCSDSQCSALLIELRENERSRVAGFHFTEQSPKTLLGSKAETAIDSSTPATQRFATKYQSNLIKSLRSEGYIGARVEVSYIPSSEPHLRLLQVEMSAGDPVSFSFNGNVAFSPEDFLNTINLFKRRQPFGNNTINILTSNIERLYREAGYLYASVNWTKTEDPSNKSARIQYQIQITEDQEIPVDQVLFEGNAALEDHMLRDLIHQRYQEEADTILSPRFAVSEQLEANVGLLQGLLMNEGFPEAQVNFEITPDDSKLRVNVVYKINEGPRILIGKINISGLPEELTAPECKNPPFSIPRVNECEEELLEFIKSQGYLRPSLSSKVEFPDRDLRIQIDPGAQTRVSRVTIDGNANVTSEVILQNLSIKEGQAWDSNALAESRRKLLRLGLFSKVEIEPLDGDLDSNEESVLVKVSERPPRSLELGAGLNSEYGVHVFGQATDRKLFNDGKTLALRLDTYYDPTDQTISQGAASLRFSIPHLFSPNYAFSEDLRYQRFDSSTQEFDVNRVSLGAFFYSIPSEGLSLSFGHTLQQEMLDNVSPDAVISPLLDTGSVRLSTISGSLNYDQRNDPINPSRGFNFSLDYSLSSESLAGDANFYGMNGKLSYLYPLSSYWLLAASGRAGSLWTFAGTDAIPITQRYYLGGRNTVRGFRENALGPLGGNGSVIGGDELLASSLELRHLLGETTSILSFLDTGNVFLRDQGGIELSEMRLSAGLGFRYLSPIGPIGFDVGHPLDEKSGEPSVRLHFSIGSNF